MERVNVFGKNRNVIKLALKSSQGTRIDGMIFEVKMNFERKWEQQSISHVHIIQ